MGFSSLATYVILFTVGLSMVAGFILTFRDFFARSSLSLEDRQEISRNKLLSDIEIINHTYNETTIEKNVSWAYLRDFEKGIFENTTASDETYPDTLVLSYDNTTGIWVSEIIELNGDFEFNTILMSGFVAEPIQSSAELRIRTANNLSTLTGEFVGPDGTSETFYSINSEENINSVHQGDSIIQIKIDLERLNQFIETPSINSIVINYQYNNILELRIKNTGKIRLDHDIIDVFVNTNRISRDEIITSNVIDEGYVSNPGLWEPDRDVLLSISRVLEPGNKMFTAINEFSSKSTKRLTIQT